MMLNEYLVGKVERLLVIETEHDGKIKLLMIPKGTILEFKVSSDYDHAVTEQSIIEMQEYMKQEGLTLKNFEFPN